MSKNTSPLESSIKAIEPVVLSESDFAQTTSNLADNITALSGDLSGSIDKLTTTLSSLLEPANSLTFTQFIFAIFVAVIGAFSAYLFNLFHWSMVEKKQKTSRSALALSLLIKDLETTAVEYWIQGFKEKKHKKIHVAEISIKSKIRLISKYIDLIAPELDTHKTKNIKQKLEEFRYEIFDLVTGGEFESKARNPSKSKAMKIAIRCSDIRAVISSLDFVV